MACRCVPWLVRSELVSSAIYRYVESRNDLLTRLIINSFESLGDAIDTASDTTVGGIER